ncbi:class I SAM-dependent methyltransferase [Desertibacillus haloalkaliphilus]|uniref:class I SAM-dependent methyltransferase n=1 Tax=Desertibacillus haloalkaliphilus TaxID=1328930 RepID=UPI001C27BEAA|nr:class I SAM-dependent methyltransferase [Desertibacillus haloalkaliphilus]MBU8906004.1 class I SAM-dependent methyltransferase [Desertibacillus haloalkaliphilus]
MNTENKSNVQSQFGKSAESYVTSKWHAKGADLAKLVDIAELDGSERVLDIATGGGHVANALAPSVKQVTAYDLTTEILAAAKSFIESNGFQNVEFVQGDAEQMPFADEAFDVVTCRIAAHHFPNPESFVQESFRSLKQGGQFLLIDNVSPEREDFDHFYNKVEKDRDYSHHRAWKKSEWLKMLEEAGFEIEETHRFTKTFVFEDWCNRMNVSEEEKNNLSAYMIAASEEHHGKFRIKVENGKVYSFMGESILIKAVK